MKRVFLYGMALASAVFCFGTAAFAQRIVGGYKPASPTDERVVAAAEFAVSKQEEEQEGLTLDSIKRAEIQVVAGTNYRLCLKVSLDEESQFVKAIVFQDLKNVYTLKSWEVVESCDESK